MNIIQHYVNVWKNYVNFSGSLSRPGYWWFVLVHIIIAVILNWLDSLFGLGNESGYGVLTGIYSLAILIPSIAAGVRRLHDIGKSGWWILIGLVPFIGWIWLIVLLAMPSKSGAAPKAPAAAPKA